MLVSVGAAGAAGVKMAFPAVAPGELAPIAAESILAPV
jgi:hypothetical protein